MIRAPVFPLALEANTTALQVTIPTTADSVWVLPDVPVSVGGLDYDTDTGEIIIPLTGVYSFVALLNPQAGVTAQIFFYSTIDVGTGHVPIMNSGRRFRVSGPSDQQVVMSSENWFPYPCKLRFYLWSDTPINMVSQTVPGSSGVIVPAIRLLLTGM